MMPTFPSCTGFSKPTSSPPRTDTLTEDTSHTPTSQCQPKVGGEADDDEREQGAKATYQEDRLPSNPVRQTTP